MLTQKALLGCGERASGIHTDASFITLLYWYRSTNTDA
jgi:hypothetical protein